MNQTKPTSDGEIFFLNRAGKVSAVSRENWGAKHDTLLRLKSVANTRVFVDIGANIGQTMIEALAFDRSINYIGFEPNPIAFYFLQLVAKANKFNATLLPWACSNAASPLKLHAMSPLDSAATTQPEIRNDTYGKQQGFWISSYPLDLFSEYLPLQNRFVMKIDVEGAEYSVITGALRTIEKYRPAIMCEVLNAHSDVEMERNNIHKVNIERFCRDYDYKIYQLVFAPGDAHGDGILLAIRPCTSLPKSVLYKDHPGMNDYLFVPREFPDLDFKA